MKGQPDLFGHNQPPVMVEFTQEQADTLLANTNKGLMAMLAILPTLTSAGGQRKVVDSIEFNKGIREALMKAGAKDSE